MSEITKLRRRLANVNRNVTEYRMTILEAQALLKEIDELVNQKQEPQQVVVNEPIVITRIMDGGDFG